MRHAAHRRFAHLAMALGGAILLVTTAVFVVTTAVFVAAAASPLGANSSGQPTWGSLHRPLRLALPEAGCVSSPLHRLSGHSIRGAGRGPIYPTMSPWVLGNDQRHPALMGTKLIWAWPAALTKLPIRVLVRGKRLDTSGAMKFQLGPQFDTAPLTNELRLNTGNIVGSFAGSNWGTTVTVIYVPAEGCYGLQLDWAGGTRTLLFKAAPRTP